MILRRSLILLLIVSSSIYAADRPTDKETSIALRQASSLLKEEAKRWKTIHEDPKKEEAVLIEEKDNFRIKVTIDPVVKNIVNSQSITREYIIPKTPEPKRGLLNVLFEGMDLYFMGGFNTAKEIDIGLMAGYTNPELMGNFGFGGYVGLRTLTAMVFYNFGNIDMEHVIIGAGVGTDYSGTAANFMIGVKI